MTGSNNKKMYVIARCAGCGVINGASVASEEYGDMADAYKDAAQWAEEGRDVEVSHEKSLVELKMDKCTCEEKSDDR